MAKNIALQAISSWRESLNPIQRLVSIPSAPHTWRPLQRPLDIDFAIRTQWFLTPWIIQKTHCGFLDLPFIRAGERERLVAGQKGNRLLEARWYPGDGMKKMSARFCSPSFTLMRSNPSKERGVSPRLNFAPPYQVDLWYRSDAQMCYRRIWKTPFV
jgi:hypothetical protein